MVSLPQFRISPGPGTFSPVLVFPSDPNPGLSCPEFPPTSDPVLSVCPFWTRVYRETDPRGLREDPGTLDDGFDPL